MEQLADALRQRVGGEVRFDAGSRALYATDSSNYRHAPIGVVIPRDVDDMAGAVAVCREFNAPLLARGGGTSLAGQCCNAAVVIDTSKYVCNILEMDPERRLARVEPGVVLDRLRAAAATHGLTFAPDPSTHSRCTLGGMIGNNSCGTHSLMGGNTVDNVEELDVLTYDGLRLRVGRTSDADLSAIIREDDRRGEIYAALLRLRDRYGELVRTRFPHIPRRVSGYNLDQLLPENGFHVARALVGTEGTCVTVLEAKVRLVPSPAVRVVLAMGFENLPAAAESMEPILRRRPIALEGMERPMLNAFEQKPSMREKIALLPPGNGLLLAEFGGASLEGLRHLAREAMAELGRELRPPAMKLLELPAQMKAVWELREAALGAASRDEGGQEYWGGWEDAAVPPEKLGSYLREFYRLVAMHHYKGFLYGHFGQGCIHARFDFDFRSPEGVRKFRAFVEEAADLVARFGGSLSGEHGDGQARSELYPKMFGPELVQAFREFKAIWDPAGKMNPGKVVDPYPLDANLRTGPAYQPWKPSSRFAFPDDRGSFERAVARCVGIGKCRREEGEVMCPSYRVTRDEEHSTRGRARLLFEMLNRDVIKGGWRDPHVFRSLDLCLACKGCKSECPVSVDMAAYKAEFLSHYYRGRFRPRSAYAFGMVFRWARLSSHFPALANSLIQSPRFGEWLKRQAGISPRRAIPLLAHETFRTWFHRRAPRNAGAPPVILWADTFNNYFSPQVGIAAVEGLEAAGFRVVIPKRTLCCGRPLYDYGMLGLARRKLRQTLRTLAPYLKENIPMVGLEPSCIAVFRDEALNLFSRNPDAQKLARRSFLLGEFLSQQGYKPPPLQCRVLLHGHCHQKAIAGMEDDIKVLERMGAEVDCLDSGCCGMAGGFGYEKDHYDVSAKAGELTLLPAVRKTPPDTLIVADGFSCREQIAQLAGRKGVHLAQVIQMALRADAATK